jgi:hypothetical protein
MILHREYTDYLCYNKNVKNEKYQSIRTYKIFMSWDSARKLETVCFTETMVSTTWRHNPEDLQVLSLNKKLQ